MFIHIINISTGIKSPLYADKHAISFPNKLCYTNHDKLTDQ